MTIYEEVLQEHSRIESRIKMFSAQMIADKSGVDIQRIYSWRRGKLSKFTWPEFEALRRVTGSD